MIHSEAAVYIARTIVGLFDDTERKQDVSHGLSLTQGDFSFTQFGEDLFDGVTKTWHTALLSARLYHTEWTGLRGLGHFGSTAKETKLSH